MAFNPVKETDAISAQNITSRLAIGARTASGAERLIVAVRLNGLNGAAATLKFDYEINDGSNTYKSGIIAIPKPVAANTTFVEQTLFVVDLASTEVLTIYAQSTNSSDTSVSGSVVFRDAAAQNTVETCATNTDMRGTDNANTTTPPTAAAIRAEIDANSTKLAAILLETGTDIPGLINALNDLSAAQVNAEIDTAISDAALATAANLATVDTVVDAIKLKTDNLPASPAATGDAMTLADDAITAAKYDQSTAFPLTSADAGSGDATATKQDQILAAIAAKDPLPVNSPESAGSIIETVRGDDHTTDSPHGAYVWDAPVATWGDLTDATITFTSRRASDDEVEIDGYTAGFTVLNANTSSQQVQLDLPSAQTLLLTPGPNGKTLTNKFDVQVVRSDSVAFTLARGTPPFGGHTIYEDQTRPA